MANLMGKGILAVGFPQIQPVFQPWVKQWRTSFKKLIYECDEGVNILVALASSLQESDEGEGEESGHQPRTKAYSIM